MEYPFTLIGYGEAGRTFLHAGQWHQNARIFDIKPLAPLYSEDGVSGFAAIAPALAESACVLSLVTADQALVAALNAAPHLSPGAYYLDMNSVAPGTKRDAADAIERAGGIYVDVAIMAPVKPAHLGVSLLVSGPGADAAVSWLTTLGFANARIVGDSVGRASTIKMLRSVMYKGLEALTAECLIACEHAGVTDDVIASFEAGWSDAANYRLDRMMVHGLRRAAEMDESVKTLESLGVSALMTQGTVQHQRQVGALGLGTPPQTLGEKLKRLREL